MDLNSTESKSATILLLSGAIASGKSGLADRLVADHGFEKIRSGAYLAKVAKDSGAEVSRAILQNIGDDLDTTTDFEWLLNEVAIPQIRAKSTQRLWLLDSVRKQRQIEHFRNHFGARVFHVHLTAAEEELKARYDKRLSEGGEYAGGTIYDDAVRHPNEIASRSLIEVADVVLDFTHGKTAEVAADLATRLRQKSFPKRQVVLISGRICNGKTGLAKGLRDQFDCHLIQSSEVLKDIAAKEKKKADRLALQALGDEMDSRSNFRWLFDEVRETSWALNPETPIVVDNVRNGKQLEYFRKHHSFTTIHAHLYASNAELERRFKKKIADDPGEVAGSYSEADLLKDESDIDKFKQDADVRIYTERSDHRDSLVRVAARLNFYSAPDVRCVDVLVGGQYGSEGKGHIVAYLAREYDILIRVGGPNAGHSVSSSSGVFKYHQLPSGTRDTDAKVLLGPGMTIDVSKLLQEIGDCNLSADRLFIDPQAMIIEQSDLVSEKGLVESIGSTGQGGGAAAARRILGRQPGKVRLARDIPELKPYVGIGPNYRGSIVTQLEIAYRKGHSILLEGTQGSGLSMYHGPYPFVTSRDTNVAGCLAEAGISPSRVRRILMVVRPTPIRVANPPTKSETDLSPTSGLLKHETTFDEIAKAAQLDAGEMKIAEKTTTTKRDRRVGWFEWDQFRRACSLNAPTDIVLTFADYLSANNSTARRFELLDDDTIKFIEELERVAQAPVSLINTRFPRKPEEKIDLRTVIDRRNWGSRKHQA